MALRWTAYLVVTAALAAGQAPRADAPVLDLARLLETYSSGAWDEAVGAVEGAGDGAANLLRTDWRRAGRAWIDAVPAAKAQRALAAAAFALETEHLRAERGAWSLQMSGVCPVDPKQTDAKFPAGHCVLEWAWSLLVERGQPDEAERAWVLALSALAGGVRDFRWLYTPTPGTMPDARGILAEALARHAGDPLLRLEQAMALAARYSITTYGGGPAPDIATLVGLQRGGPPSFMRTRVDPRETVATALRLLVNDPDVGAEARMRLGYFLWAIGDVDGGRAELASAAEAASDADVKYLARFLNGWTALQAGKADEARAELGHALRIRPQSQSAALALAALELQRGEALRAEELVNTSLAHRPDDVDPWRTFLYGHHPELPRLLADLRRQVSR